MTAQGDSKLNSAHAEYGDTVEPLSGDVWKVAGLRGDVWEKNVG